MVEHCIKCTRNRNKASKAKIIKEINEFLKNPTDFYVRYNSITGFYKFERIK